VIAYINVRGNIDARETYNFAKALGSVPKKNLKFLAILVNSAGGAPAQCHIISKKLKSISQEKNVPIYTFAEDQATSGGYYLLSCGDKVFADNASLIGGIGALHKHYNIAKFLKGYDIYVEKYITSKETLNNRVHYMEKLTKDSQKVVQRILEDTHGQFIQQVEERRGSKITVPENERKGIVYEGDVWTGKKAKEFGLVDDITVFRDYVLMNYPDAKVVDVTRLSLIDRIKIVLSRFVQVSSDPSLLNFIYKNELNK